jgi:RNA polymerase sigma-70 factor (ECF subfamily)
VVVTGVIGLEPGERGMERTVDGFTDWVRPHLPAMAQLATRLVGPTDRDDIVQESLARAWRRWSTFDPERGTPRGWLLAIVADRARRSTRRRHPELLVEPPTLAENDVDLERAIRALPARQRMAVELHYLLDLDVLEVAEVMGCAEGTVKSTLHDARARLRALLEEQS